MVLTVALNGFGRIGRLVFRELVNRNINLVAINDLGKTPKQFEYLAKYDSSHGIFNAKISLCDKYLKVNDKCMELLKQGDPSKLPWKAMNIDFVIDATGVFKTVDKLGLHLKAGAKKAIVTAPSPDVPMFVCGVNTNKYKPDIKLLSNASCTTNCLSPLVKVIHENFGIMEGLMTTVHSITISQPIVDTQKANFRLGRSGLQNIIPSTTGAAKAVGKVIPEISGKLTGMAFRVPLACGSVVDLTVKLCQDTTINEINQAMKCAAKNELKGIIQYTEEPIVSSDIVGNPHNTVYDATAGIMMGKNFCKLIAWYDNEYMYAVRVVDLLEYASSIDECANASKSSGCQ